MLKKENFLKGIEYLEAVFQYKMTKDQLALYYNVISEKIKDSAYFMRVADFILLNETRFPAIATFIKYNVEVGITDEQRESNMQKALDAIND